jgi:thiol-disulfide isomerase/thioredoxin
MAFSYKDRSLWSRLATELPASARGLLLLAAGCAALFAQPSAALPGCEARPEVRRILDEKLSQETLQEMKFTERVALRRDVLEDLIAKYPRESEPYRRLLQATREDDTDHYTALADRFRKQAASQPDDPLALYVAGLALSGIDTPASIHFLERARSQAPNFAWPALELADIYNPGTKRPDKQRSAEQIAAFFAVCPSSTDANAQHRLGVAGTSELQARVAAAVRARLATETDPRRLRDYAALWGLEFRAHPPQEHDALRKQVAEDLKRLESLNPKPDAGWLIFLKNGYRKGGAPPETITAKEDRVIQAFPHSDEAYGIVRERWEAAHKEPDDQKDAVAWAKYNREYRAALRGWMARFTDSRELQHEEWFSSTQWDLDVPAEEELRAMDDYLAYTAAYERPFIRYALQAASFLLDRNLQPRRVFDLLQGSDKLIDQWYFSLLGDNLSAEAEEHWLSNEVIDRQVAAGRILVAARLADEPAAAERFRPFIEREPPANSWPSIEELYWKNRGRLAALEERKADALTYYQKALHARKNPPQPYEGRIIDDTVDEARALWKRLGGTETAWAVWSQLPAARIRESAESGWKKPTKTMPAFELADLSGKTWSLKSLGGKAVLINVWATWCVPCKAELPHLQKLYEKVKDRKDLQILTLTIDEDLGAVAPFLKEKGYTFPVLPAYGLLTGQLAVETIPQNWILDTKGEWSWTGMPDGPDVEWEAAMLKQIESVK